MADLPSSTATPFAALRRDGHVNNAVYSIYLEEARIGLGDLIDHLARVEIDFRPSCVPERTSVRTLRLGTKSFDPSTRPQRPGRRKSLVSYDYERAQSVPVLRVEGAAGSPGLGRPRTRWGEAGLRASVDQHVGFAFALGVAKRQRVRRLPRRAQARWKAARSVPGRCGLTRYRARGPRPPHDEPRPAAVDQPRFLCGQPSACVCVPDRDRRRR